MNNNREKVEELVGLLEKEYKNILEAKIKAEPIYINEIIMSTNNLLQLIINDEYNLAVFLLEKAEALLLAVESNDSVQLIDILKYEMKPKLLEYVTTLL